MTSIPFMEEAPPQPQRMPSQEELRKLKLQEQREYLESAVLGSSIQRSLDDQYSMHNPNFRDSPSSYYERTHLEVYEDEVAVIRAALEGKIPAIKNGEKVYTYPEEVFYEVIVQTEDGGQQRVYLPEQEIDPRYMIETGKTKVRPIKKPFCTPEGQREILSFVASKLSGGTALSYYTSVEHILKRTEDDGLTLCELMYLNGRKWNIDPTRFDAILSLITDRLETIRLRALLGKTSELPTKNQNIHTVENKGDVRQSLPILGGLMGNNKAE